MSKMQCTKCNTEQTIVSKQQYTLPTGKQFLMALECGHAFVTDKMYDFKSTDGRTLYPFQEQCLDWLDSPARTGRGKLIADEQGLGKTVEALCHIKGKPKKVPVLIICPAKLTRQWMGEIHRWNDAYAFLISGKGILPGFKYYVVSVDLLRNIGKTEIQKLGIKTIIIDECQSIKNMGSQRTQQVMDLARPTGTCNCGHSYKNHNQELVVSSMDGSRYNKWTTCTESDCDCKEYKDKQDITIIGLSGTPILNRVIEYFPILHLIDPQRFQTEQRFRYEWIDTYIDRNSGKPKDGGIVNVQKWKDYTKDIIIRRERAEVMPELPSIDRQIRWVDLTKEAQQEYDKQERGFLQEMIKSQLEGTDSMMHLLAYISRMRHIIGLSKIPDCIDYVTDFLLSTNRKICIFTQHIDVAEILVQELNKYLVDGGMKECLAITGGMNADKLGEVQRLFNTDMEYKVLVASTQAGGLGLNLQEQCGDCVILERQWNPPKEEQAISRFVRIGFMKSAAVKLNSVIAQYILAIGTIDDWITQLIEEKRAIFEQAVNATEMEAAEMTLMKALMEKILVEGRRKWKLSA